MSKSIFDQHLLAMAPLDRSTLELIDRLGQRHLVENWPEPNQDVAQKSRLLAQFRELDARYPGGLKSYLDHARELLERSRRGVTPYRDYVPQVPEGFRVDFGSPAFSDLEGLGLGEASRCGFVMVAGGLGERLGFPGIKVEVTAETATGRSFLAAYVANIAALERRSNQLLGEHRQVPFAIMTSDDTHAGTVRLLADNENFGLAPDQVTILKQERVVSIADPTPRLATVAGNPYELMTKPHGHGDVHALMHQTGLARRWHEQGVRWLLFFQDTNALTFNVFLAALGTSVRERLDVNSFVVPRLPGEAAGGIVRLVKGDSALTINVEYNQLDALLRAAPGGAGDVADASGFSPFPGNTNIFILALDSYTQALEATGGAVPEFVNPKYADESRTKFKSATRLECMMQDYPLLVPKARVAFTQFDRAACFSPVKNSLKDAATRQAQVPPLPAECAATGEADLYTLHRRILRIAGADVESAEPEIHCGVKVELFPIVVMAPDLLVPVAAMARRVTSVRISKRSTLVIEADAVEIRGLSLDGALVVRAVPGAKVILQDLVVSNRGWRARELDPAEQAIPDLAIRGFFLDRIETVVIDAKAPGEYVVDQARLADAVTRSDEPGSRILTL